MKAIFWAYELKYELDLILCRYKWVKVNKRLKEKKIFEIKMT